MIIQNKQGISSLVIPSNPAVAGREEFYPVSNLPCTLRGAMVVRGPLKQQLTYFRGSFVIRIPPYQAVQGFAQDDWPGKSNQAPYQRHGRYGAKREFISFNKRTPALVCGDLLPENHFFDQSSKPAFLLLNNRGCGRWFLLVGRWVFYFLA